MLIKYTFDTSQIPAGTIVTADIADAGVTPPKIKTKTVVALADAAAVLTATQMIDSGIFTITPSVARTLTTDTAVNIVAGLADYQVGTWFDITIVNTAAFDVTLAAGAGVTLSGNVIIHKAAGTWHARIDSATAVTLYRMGFNLEDGTVSLAKIVNGTGLSLIGRSANSAGANADIVGTDGQVARVSGTALGFGTIVAAGIDSDAVTTIKILDANVTEPKIVASSSTGLGVLRVARAKYSFAVDGGAISTITPNLNATIPDNAIIIGGSINSTTAPTSGGLATISFGTSAGSSATSLLGITAIATFTLDSTINSVATFAAPVKMTASGSITLTIADFVLTAGIIEVTLLYFVAAA